MKLMFLGTGGSEGAPCPWCECEHCRAGREGDGRGRRMRSMALIDDRLLIDCGPDLLSACLRYNLSLSNVRTMLMTHEHGDHLYLPVLNSRRPPFTSQPLPLMTVYGSNNTLRKIRDIPVGEEALSLRCEDVEPFQSWTSDGYSVTSLLADHGKSPTVALMYAISDGERSVLYALDTGPFPEETWEYLEGPAKEGWRFNVVVMDMTWGTVPEPRWPQHMNFSQVVEHRDRLREAGLLKPDCRVLGSHFAHAGTPAYPELQACLCEQGIEPAYDGLVV